jgi:calcium-dependent protein kinase
MIAGAVAYCHANNICHRDLKPENCLLLTKDPNSPLKVIDFGLSCAYVDKDRKVDLTQTAGSPYYMAPEILSGHYTEKCDVWSLGVMLYIMLTGIPPFYGNTDPAIYNMIRKG